MWGIDNKDKETWAQYVIQQEHIQRHLQQKLQCSLMLQGNKALRVVQVMDFFSLEAKIKPHVCVWEKGSHWLNVQGSQIFLVMQCSVTTAVIPENTWYKTQIILLWSYLNLWKLGEFQNACAIPLLNYQNASFSHPLCLKI